MAEPVPQWAQELVSHINELEQFLFDVPILRDKTITNYNEIENIHKTISVIKQNTRLVPQILELAIANYTACEKLSKKVHELENAKINCPNCIQ